MPISGVRGTGNITQVKRVIDMADKISVLEPDASPLTVLTRKLNKKVAINPKYSWMEEASLNKVDAVGTGINSSATTLPAVDGSKFRAGDVVRNVNTGEQVLVTAVATNDLTIVRAYGTTAAAAMTAADVLLIVGNANQEGATKRTLLSGNESEVFNYTQIFRTPFGVTGTNMSSEMYGGKDLKHVQMMAGIEHNKELERQFVWGEKKEDTSGSQPRRTTAGLNSFIATNVTADGNGTLTETEFETFTRTGFRYGSSAKFLMAAPIYLSAISTWAKGRLQIVSTDKTYGINVMQYLSPHGVINLVNAKIFSEVSAYAGYAFLVDMESVGYRYLADRDTRLHTEIQANDEDGRIDEYRTEAGFQLSQEKKNSVMKGVTTFA